MRHPKLRNRRVIATLAVGVLLPTFAVATAASGGQPDKPIKAPPSAQETKNLADRIARENSAAEKAGLPKPKGGGRNDCETVRKDLPNLKARGQSAASCIQESTAPLSQDVIDQVRQKLKDQVKKDSSTDEIPPANFPAPSGTTEPGVFQANGLTDYDNFEAHFNPVPGSCNFPLAHYADRKEGCQWYVWDHLVVDTSNGQLLGVGHFVSLDWAYLREASSRAWDHHHALFMYNAQGIVRTNGLFVWMQAVSEGDADKINATPADGWVFVKLGDLKHGRSHIVSMRHSPGIDYSTQRSIIISFSTAGSNLAVGQPPPLYQVRCDSGIGLPGSLTGGTYLWGSGCVFHWHYGNFRLSLSDPNAKDAVAFYRDMQRDLPTHPGRWPNSLGRATDAQRTANRLVSDRACVPLRGTLQGYQCDEYPFAATDGGAASGPRGVNWDVRLVPSHHNLRVGGLLSAFYQDQRMFMGVDRFYVDIVP